MPQPPRPPYSQNRTRFTSDDRKQRWNTERAQPGNEPGNPVTAGVQDARETIHEGVESVGSIVGGIIEDLQGIVRGEVQLAKTELKEEATRMGAGAAMLGAAAAVGLVGFIFLMLALTYLLHQWMRMWYAAGIVALGLLLIAGILAMIGKNRVQEANLVPEKTIDSVKEDQQWAKRQMNSVTK